MRKFIVSVAIACGLFSSQAFAAGNWTDTFETGGAWGGGDGQNAGIISTQYAHSGTKSMLCETTSTQSRPWKYTYFPGDPTPPSNGWIKMYVYDDGADIKSFDIRICDDVASTASLGLRDATAGSATNYVYGWNNVLGDTGIQRSVGWHKVDFLVKSTGTEIRLDGRTFPGNTNAGMTRTHHIKIFTDGSTANPNQIWIDDASYTMPEAGAKDWQDFQ